jgi:hypothetical protein
MVSSALNMHPDPAMIASGDHGESIIRVPGRRLRVSSQQSADNEQNDGSKFRAQYRIS